MSPRSHVPKWSSSTDEEDDDHSSSTTGLEMTFGIDHSSYYVSSILLLFLAPALGGFLYGFDIGATSFAITSMEDSFNQHDDEENDAAWRIAIFVATPSVAAFLGSALMFYWGDSIGRKRELLYGSICYMIGAFWQIAPFLFGSAVMVAVKLADGTEEEETVIDGPRVYWLGFFCGRFIYGLGIGITMHGAPAYLGEMLPHTIRGALLSMKEVFVVLGMLFGYILGSAHGNDNDGAAGIHGWAFAYVWSMAVSISMFVILQFLPKSYRWLVLRGRPEDALQSLRFVYKPSHAEEQFEELVQSILALNTDSNDDNNDNYLDHSKPKRSNSMSSFFFNRRDIFKKRRRSGESLFFSTQYRSSIIAGMGLVTLQQITGQPSISSYITLILTSIGLQSFSSIFVGFFKLLATFLAVFAVERAGRKKLLLWGCYLMLAALFTLWVVFLTKRNIDDDDEQSKISFKDIIILIAMLLYIGGYQVGFGPMTWLILGEIFPLSIRGQAVAAAVQWNFLLNSLVQVLVPYLERGIGLANTFGIFGLFTVYAIFFIQKRVLETKGLTLEEIETKYNNESAKISNTIDLKDFKINDTNISASSFSLKSDEDELDISNDYSYNSSKNSKTNSKNDDQDNYFEDDEELIGRPHREIT